MPQEVAGKNVDLVLLGLDLFPDYATYTAAGLPVIGMLPILPADYTANALFLTGGNATTMGAVAAAAKEHYGAETIAIVSADNQGANASEASLTASLDLAGIAHSTIKGGDNETDAGYQGLMRQAADGDPDLIVSLYADAGCVGTIRGRASLSIEIPVVATSICADQAVIDIVGDDALGWSFVGIQTNEDTPEKLMLQEMLSPALGVSPEEVDPRGARARWSRRGDDDVARRVWRGDGGGWYRGDGIVALRVSRRHPRAHALARWIPGRMRPGDRLSLDLRLHVPIR